MRDLRRLLLVVAAAAAACDHRPAPPPPAAVSAVSAPPGVTAARPAAALHETALEESFAAIERASTGKLGVVALQLPSGRRASLHGDEPFPMASTFKVAVAMALLRRVDRGEVGLTDMVHLGPDDMRPGMGNGLAERWPRGADLALVDLAESMVEDSDNTATDALLVQVGGPAGVTDAVRAVGVIELRVDRTERELAADLEREGARFPRDPRDHATPAAMADLLARIASGGAASAASTAELHRWLRATRTGPMRLRAGLPTGVELLHKTGTCVRDGASVVVADVGFVPLDAGARIVLAAYVGDAKGPVEVQEAALASVARAAYAAFGPGQRPTSSPTAP